MSDISDVQAILANIAATAMYPSGTGQPSVTGKDIKIYPGWPDAATLDPDLLQGIAHVSIFPSGTESNVTRYPRDWKQTSINSTTLTISTAGKTITVGGSVDSPFSPVNVAALVDGQPYVYSVQPGDTALSVAAGLAALIPGATPTDTSVSVPGTVNAVRIGVTGMSIRELKRQKRTMQLTVWAYTPAQRDVVSKALDIALSANDFLLMPDGYGARIIYEKSHIDDSLQKANLYRRDFFYSVEYATTETRTDYAVVALTLTAGVQTPDPARYAPAITINY